MKYERAHEAFRKAVDSAGGQTAFGRIVGCTQGNIWQLLRKGSALPGQYVLKAEAATGVSRHDLRPDLYPRETERLATSARPVAFHHTAEMQGPCA